MPLFKKHQRYKVSRKYDYIQTVCLLNGSSIECNLTVDSTGADCLDNVLQRLEIGEPELFGLQYMDNSGQLLWVDPDKPLKKQLDKHGTDTEVSLAIFYYIDRAYALRDEQTRYNYYLQLKSDILESRIYCSLEQAILLASYSLQAEYQSYEQARKSNDYIREIERLDTHLLPRSLVGDYDSTALADIAQHIVSSHMMLSGVTSHQADISYIHMVQQMDGYGIVYLKDLTEGGESVYLGNSDSCVTVRRNDGHLLYSFPRSNITAFSQNKKCFYIHHTNKKMNAKFLLNDVDAAKYVLRICEAQHDFHIGDHEHMLNSDSELGFDQESGPLQIRHLTEFSRAESSFTNEQGVDVEEFTEELPEERLEYQAVPEPLVSRLALPEPQANYLSQSTPDILESSINYDNEYATMKFNGGREDSSAPGNTSSLYGGYGATPLMEQLQKNPLIHRSLTALAEYRLNEQGQGHIMDQLKSIEMGSQSQRDSVPLSTGSSSHNHLSIPTKPAKYPGRAHTETRPIDLNGLTKLPSYRPSPDYETVMRLRAVNTQAYSQPPVPHMPYQDPGYRGALQRYAVLSASQPDILDPEPLYANINPAMVTKHRSEAQLFLPQSQTKDDYIYQLPQSHRLQTPQATGNPYYNIRSNPDLTRDLHHNNNVYQGPDITQNTQRNFRPPPSPPLSPPSNSPLPQRLYQPVLPIPHQPIMSSLPPTTSQTQYKSFENLNMMNAEGGNSNRSSHSSRSSYVNKGAVRESALSPGESAPSPRDYVVHRTVSPRPTSVMRSVSDISPSRRPFDDMLDGMSSRSPIHQNSGPRSGERPVFVSPDERLSDLEETLSSGRVSSEYEPLLKKRQLADCRVGLRPENAARNRFPNVLPYEDTRVRLIPTGGNPHGYINASHVRMTIGSEDLNYIATQNPLPDTISDFWRMVWAHNVSIISMVTELEERGTQKCPRYWPSAPGSRHAFTIDDLTVVLQYSTASVNFTTSCLRVAKAGSKEQRTLWHVQYTDWHQNGTCPKDINGFLMFLDELNTVRLHVMMSRDVSPRDAAMLGPPSSPCLLVHCSTGVGRSGVVILTDVMRKCLEQNQRIEVAERLRDLRDQRMYMVQTIHQYRFVYDSLISYLRGGRLI